MEMRLLPLRAWLLSAIWAMLLHVGGALVIDYVAWTWGFAYEVMAGQFLLLAGGVWLLMVLVVFLARLRRWGYIDPLRIILWVGGVSLASAPLKAVGERLLEPALREAYDAYPQRRSEILRAYLRKQQIPPAKVEEVIATQIELFQSYRERQRHLGHVIGDRLKVLGVLGLIYGVILGLLLRGGGTAAPPGPVRAGGSGGNAASS